KPSYIPLSLSTMQVARKKLRMAIELTQTENNIRNLLVSCCDHIKKTESKEIILRWTGGWVRDKLLGLPSSDLDVTIDKLTGYEFATRLENYARIHEPRALSKGAENIHLIAKNPDKSKHLETAIMRLYNNDLDFVNLRSEEYTCDSRIPVMKFGTPKEDAERRDATLNALFYNLQTQAVEDYTGKGLKDLSDGILRTPLDPIETFLDDPLRVLRLIRFAARFDMVIASETEEAMKDDRIKDAMRLKISRERIGAELKKIFNSAKPQKALMYIYNNGLYESIFSLCDKGPLAGLQVDLARDVQRALEVLEVAPSPLDLSKFWLAVSLVPYSGHKVLTGKNQDRSMSAAEYVVREGIKFAGSDASFIAAVSENIDETIACQSKIDCTENTIDTRVRLGNLVRALGSDWLTIICAQAVMNHEVKWETMINKIRELGLENCYEMKPLLTGKDLMSILNEKPGPWLAGKLQEVIDIQLGYPDISKDALADKIKSLK
ncbi:hypothetical protein CANCADRAFT_27053, partial [Tortispora caseinolytica NRRL Y-17796]